MKQNIIKREDVKTVETVETVETVKTMQAVDYAVQIIEATDKGAMIANVPLDMVQATKQAIIDLMALEDAHKVNLMEAEKARQGLSDLFTPKQATQPVTELSARIKNIFGDKPTQSEFLSSVLMSIGMTHDKAESVHASLLTKAVAEAIAKAYGDKLPDTVTGHKTTWRDDSTTRQRISNHISKPPKFYVEGNC